MAIHPATCWRAASRILVSLVIAVAHDCRRKAIHALRAQSGDPVAALRLVISCIGDECVSACNFDPQTGVIGVQN